MSEPIADHELFAECKAEGSPGSAVDGVAGTFTAGSHTGQLQMRGRSHLDHLAGVVALLKERWPAAPPEVVSAALLHDVMDSTNSTPGSLLADGIGLPVVLLITRVTRPAGTPYVAWIHDLAASGDLWAIRIELAYVAHKLLPAPAAAGPAQPCYAVARDVLEEAERKLQLE